MARVTPPFLSTGGTSVSHESKSVFEIFLSFTVFAERLTQNFASGERRKKRKKRKKNAPQKMKSWGNLLKRAQKNFERFSTKKICLRAKPVVTRAKTVNHELKFVI